MQTQALLLGGAGVLMLVVSLLMLYVGRILLRDDTFADRVDASLEDPRVGEFIALRITDAVIVQQPDLTAFRPILVVVTRGIVTSAPFRALLRPAVAKAHHAVLSSTAENILLAIPDVKMHGVRCAAVRHDLPDGLVGGRGLPPIVQKDVHTVLRQPSGNGYSDCADAAGHESDAFGTRSHVLGRHAG